MMRIALIWAMDKNRVIGRNNSLPWRLSSDLKHFKQVTMGKPVIMGRKTWESLGRALPGRPNIVISTSAPQGESDATWMTSLDAALTYAQHWIDSQDVNPEEVIIMGGAQIYALAIPVADRLYVTQVQASVEGDTKIAPFDLSNFKQTNSTTIQASEKDEFTFDILQFDKM